jgi:hypothetical protein
MARGRRRVATTGLFALALGAGGAEDAGAQPRWLRLPDAGFVAAGVSGVATGALDERLAARGFPTFGRTARAASLGTYWRLPSGVMLGGEWHGIIFGERLHDGREVGLGGGYGTLGVGYAAELSSRARVYPRLGLGVGGLGLWVEREGEVVGFDDALTRPQPAAEREREQVLSRAGVVVDLGAGLELLPGGRGRGPLLGLRLGYLATPFTTRWHRDDVPVSGGPNATLAGPYIRAVVGVGRR